jgi:hemolysin D
MGMDNSIELAVSSVLKNPILSVLREINIYKHMGLFHTKDKHEFTPLLVEIEERPTSPLGRSLLWSLFAFLVIALLWLFFAKIDVVVSARGKVIPVGEIKTLQPVETGVIGSILVKEGQSVKKGEVLMEIDPSVTQSDLESKQKNLSLLELEIERLDAQINDRAFHPSSTCQESSAIATQQMMYTSGKLAYDQQRQVLQEQIRQNDGYFSTISFFRHPPLKLA